MSDGNRDSSISGDIFSYKNLDDDERRNDNDFGLFERQNNFRAPDASDINVPRTPRGHNTGRGRDASDDIRHVIVKKNDGGEDRPAEPAKDTTPPPAPVKPDPAPIVQPKPEPKPESKDKPEKKAEPQKDTKEDCDDDQHDKADVTEKPVKRAEPEMDLRVSHGNTAQRFIDSSDGYDLEHGKDQTVTGSDMDIRGVRNNAEVSYSFENAHTVRVELESPWNSLKNIEVNFKRAGDVSIDNFVHADVTLGNRGDSNVEIDGAKRGFIKTGKGHDTVDIDAQSNGAGWSNTFDVKTGKGNDILEVTGDKGHTQIKANMGKGHDEVTLDGDYKDSDVKLGRGHDRFNGGSGDDVVHGGRGNDILHGGQRAEAVREVEVETTLNMTFVSTSAGYHNTIGAYTIASDGTIQGVGMAFENAKRTASGDNYEVTVSGEEAAEFGYFIISNGANKNGHYNGLDLENGELRFVYDFGGANERAANIADDARSVSLVYQNGSDIRVLRGDIYHSTTGLNFDGADHVRETDLGNGSQRLGFEDLRNLGDADFNDVIVDISIASERIVTSDVVDAASGDDILHGGKGNDRIFGYDGNDELHGGKGRDHIEGGHGDDIIRGGAGDDVIYGLRSKNAFKVEDGDDIIHAGKGNDFVQGNMGNDEIHGGQGNDDLRGGRMNDVVHGGRGNDVIYGQEGADILHGGKGNDRIYGEDKDGISPDPASSNDEIYGGRGNDHIEGGRGDDIIRGGAGDDVIYGFRSKNAFKVEDGDDIIHAGKGNDFVQGNMGNDEIYGGRGNDDLRGGRMNDVVHGGKGHDIIYGQEGADILHGGKGNDIIYGEDKDGISPDPASSNDEIYGGRGNDHIEGGRGDDIIRGGAGDDVIYGFRSKNAFKVEDGDDIIHAGKGNDFVQGNMGNDEIHGGQGNDELYGGRMDDELHGGKGNDRLFGQHGDDILRGGKGHDVLKGGDGSDELYGGKGNDTLYFDTSDTINGGQGYDTLTYEGQRHVDLRGANVQNIEQIHMGNDDLEESIMLDLEDILDMTENGELFVTGTAGQDQVKVVGCAERVGEVETMGRTFVQYSHDGGADLYVQVGLAVNGDNIA